MRRFIFHIVLGISVLSGCNNPDSTRSPYEYVKRSVRIMDRQGLYAYGDEWTEARDSCLNIAKNIRSYDDAHNIISSLVKIAGGKHSFLRPPVTDTTSYIELQSCASFRGDSILVIDLPAHSGVKINDSVYVYSVLDRIVQYEKDIKGIIINLQGNHGGDMYPMIAAISPLLEDGIVLKFKGRKKMIRIVSISLDMVRKFMRLEEKYKFTPPLNVPIAILTDSNTASSGEATLLCFRGMKNVRTFGRPTAGYASANASYALTDGYTLVLTVGKEIARTGEMFCSDPIPPDVITDSPFEDAIAWLTNKGE